MTPLVPAFPLFSATQMSGSGRFLKFCVVGAFGLAVNTATLYLAHSVFGLALSLAAVCAYGVATSCTYIVHDYWTFGKRAPSLAGFLKFSAVGVGALAITVASLQGLTRGLGVNYLVANLVGTVLGTLWNFGINAVWTWRGPATGTRAPLFTMVSAAAVQALAVGRAEAAGWRRRLNVGDLLVVAAPWLLLLVPMVFNAVLLLPELVTPVPSVNDDAFHYMLVQRASAALANGANPTDHWSPGLELGFPQFLHYQHLPHLFVVGLDRLLFRSVSLFDLFNLVRYGLLVGFPVTVYWSLRRMRYSQVAAGVAGAAAGLLSANSNYGFEYDSYVWRGLGMYTQLWAMHLIFISLACIYRVLEEKRGCFPAILAIAALTVSHLLYGLMMALSAGVMLLMGLPWRHLTRDWREVWSRFWRLAILGGMAALIAAYFLVDFERFRPYLLASSYLQSWKYDSFGARQVLTWLVTGDLLDYGRLPVFTILLAVGAMAALLVRTRQTLVALALLAFWLALYFGRPTWGPLLNFLPFHEELILHRFIGGVHLAAIMLIGVAGEAIWRIFQRLARAVFAWPGLHRRPRWAPLAACPVFVIGVLVLLIPAFRERSGYYALNTQWMERSRSAVTANPDVSDMIRTIQRLPPGRTYAGLREGWGNRMKVGDLHFFDLLTFNGVPALSPPYQSVSLNSNFIWHFDDSNPAHYRLFNVRYVVAPRGLAPQPFWTRVKTSQRFALYTVVTTGYAEFAQAVERKSMETDDGLFASNLAWFQGSSPARRRFIQYDYPSRDFSPGAPAAPGCASDGSANDQLIGPGRMVFQVSCPTDGTLVIKATYHPNWRVTVDGRPAKTFMVSPSFIGVAVPAGTRQVEAAYTSSALRLVLMVVALALLSLMVVGKWRRWHFLSLGTLAANAISRRWSSAVTRWKHRRDHQKLLSDSTHYGPGERQEKVIPRFTVGTHRFFRMHWSTVWALAVLVVFTAMVLFAGAQKSETTDEGLFIASGAAQVQTGNSNFDLSHPPLLRWIAGLTTTLFGGARAPQPFPLVPRGAMDLYHDKLQDSFNYGPTFFYDSGNSHDRALFWGRFPFALIGALLGWLIFLQARSLFGAWPAAAVVAVFAFTPEVLAQAQWAHSDLASALTLVLVAFALARDLQERSWRSSAFLGVALALAVATKLTALVLWPAVLLLMALFSWQAGVRRLLPRMALALSVFYILLVVAYLPDLRLFGPHEFLQSDLSRVGLGIFGPLLRVIPLPDSFLKGVVYTALLSDRGQIAFLHGEIRSSGWWYYFPLAVFLKYPTGLLLMGAAGLVLFLRGPHSRASRVAWTAPPIIIFAAAMFQSIDIGVRSVLPIAPFLALWSGAALGSFKGTVWSQRWAPAYILSGVLLVSSVISGIAAYPNYLAYFNPLLGGTKNADKWLIDSNLDWGQDLPALAAELKSRNISAVRLAYLGAARPSFYGITALDPQVRAPGWYAISRSHLSGWWPPGDPYGWLRGLQPVKLVGGSIALFHVDQSQVRDALVPDRDTSEGDLMQTGLDLLYTKHDPSAAASVFRTVLSKNPNHYGATYQLATALDLAGSRVEARPLWEAVVRMAATYSDDKSLNIARERLAETP